MNPLLRKMLVPALKFLGIAAANTIVYRYVVPKTEEFVKDRVAKHQAKRKQ